jgi:hypothetical protein
MDEIILGPDKTLAPIRWIWWTFAFIGAVFSTALFVGDAAGFVPLLGCAVFLVLALWWRPVQLAIRENAIVIQNPIVSRRIDIADVREVGCRWIITSRTTTHLVFVRGSHGRINLRAPKFCSRDDGASTVEMIKNALRNHGWVDPTENRVPVGDQGSSSLG